MKNQLMAAAAVLALMSASSVAYAGEGADVKALKAQAAELKKQNAALEKRLNKLETQQPVASSAAPSAGDFVAQVTKGPLAVVTDEGPICWKGICIFGTVDGGLGWVSHGLPQNGKAYFGEALIGKNSNRPYFGIAQNNMSQTGLGIKGSVELMPGLSGVFMASTGIDLIGGQLANGPGSLVDNNGLPRSAYSLSGDGSRGGQAFNDQLYIGLASPTFGQLTFGRHKAITTDMVGAYDPMGAAYAFSVIGYSGTPVAGMGDTAWGRLDNTLKYRVEYGPMHFGALYKFVDGNSGYAITGTGAVGAVLPTKNDGYQFNIGGKFGALEADVAAGHFNQAISSSALAGGVGSGSVGGQTYTSLTGAVSPVVLGSFNNTLAGTVTDNTGVVVGAKYTWDAFKFFAGYSWVEYTNPSDPVGVGAQTQGGYVLSTVNNRPFARHPKVLQTEWVGVKYAYDPKTDFALAYYHEGQATYTPSATCAAAAQTARAATCAGTLDAVSFMADYHFTKRFDVYGGMMVSAVGGGLASGYFNTVNWAPTVGARFTF